MARRKNRPESVRAKCHLAERLRLIRTEVFGERGGPELARRLGVPIRTWYNYEIGVTVPAEVLLRFIELTSVDPLWLLDGRGARYRTIPTGTDSVDSARGLLLTALEYLEREGVKGPRLLRCDEEESSDEDLSETPDQAEVPGPGYLGPPLDDPQVRVEGDAMAPIARHGALVAYSPVEESASALDGSLVVVWLEGETLVRWFHRSGRYALLSVENPHTDRPTCLLDLQTSSEPARVRRVLWICTPH